MSLVPSVVSTHSKLQQRFVTLNRTQETIACSLGHIFCQLFKRLMSSQVLRPSCNLALGLALWSRLEGVVLKYNFNDVNIYRGLYTHCHRESSPQPPSLDTSIVTSVL